MNWIEELALKIKARATNVFILQTLDFDRIGQLVNALKTDLFKIKALEGYKPMNVIIWDYNLNKLYSERGELPEDHIIEISQNIKAFLTRHEGHALIIQYIWSEDQARALTPPLISIAQDNEVFGANSVVFVFTSSEYLFPEALLKFSHVINIPISTDEERKAKLKLIIEEITKARPEIKLRLTPEIIVASRGLTLKETESAALESIFRYRKLKKEVFTEYKQTLFKKYGLTITYPETTFDHVGGYQYLKQYFRNKLKKAITEPETLKKYGLEPPRGILLYGPPGTGKSFIASALAAEIGIPMVKLSPADFLRGIVGESEARVRQITQLLESLAPVIVFFDEFESIGMARAAQTVTDSGVTRRVQNMLLEYLGDRHRKAFIIGATNFIEQVDPAFIRPGRVDEIVPMLYPDYDARLEILKIHTSKVRKIPLAKDLDLKVIAMKTAFWTGAELEKLCISAAEIAMQRGKPAVDLECFLIAKNSMTIEPSERETQLKRMIQALRKMENVNQLILEEALATIQKHRESDKLAKFAESL
mgnify:CR=1 FL=1